MADKKGPLLSICIPTYNRPECVKKSLSHYLETIRQCGFEDRVEICISDNSSSRKTEKTAKEFSGKLRIKYSRNRKNLGYDRNVILSMSMASGKYLQLVGDELLYSASALAAAVGALSGGSCGAAIFDDDRLFPGSSNERPMQIDRGEIRRKALSYEWVKKRSITHIDYVIIRRSDFREYLKRMGGHLQGFYGLTFIQMSFYLFSLWKSRSVCVLGAVNDGQGSNAPNKVGVYFPSDDARAIYLKYFLEFKACRAAGIISGREFALFRRNFFLSAINHLIRIRTHMYPRIYQREEAEVLRHVVAVEEEYSGGARVLLSLLRKLLFIRQIPYHLLYFAFVFFRNNVLGRRRVSAVELYERCLGGEGKGKKSLYKTDF